METHTAELAVRRMFQTITDTSPKIKHPVFDMAFSSLDNTERLVHAISPQFAPGIWEFLEGPTVPTRGIFKALPSYEDVLKDLQQDEDTSDDDDPRHLKPSKTVDHSRQG
ncbi:hypothetical protein QBC37DRAFT_403542 [Rhypophila decipiens]|uniref:Uncharacterized protein n=1 Tax=Rhypophila decipiens TaxID=261697 RepID=A0AAN6Y570_9PEZI|nr:hypothetical protein QBC37DRAFT_403542 [Rhypophila decipiens]